MKLTNNKILITGGGTGIGLGLTEYFLQSGNQVIICGRRKEVLDSVSRKHPGVITRLCDLSGESGRLELFQWVREEHPDLRTLVNNAGIQHWMDLADGDFYTKAKEEIAVNIEAPIHLTILFLQLESPETIINVSSGLSFVPYARVPVYSATKAFLRSFTLSLRQMVKGREIEVIELIPPALNTDLGGKGLHDHAPPVSDFIRTVQEKLREGKKEIAFASSEDRLNGVPGEWIRIFEKMHQG